MTAVKKHLRPGAPGFVISLLGLLALGGAYILWFAAEGPSAPGALAALFSALLFAGVCLPFVPRWTAFWSREGGEAQALADGCTARELVKIFFVFLAADGAILLLGHFLRLALGFEESLWDSLRFWTCLDSGHYLDIAEDWYLSQGSRDRLVQLVFLPGYPLAVRLGALFTGGYLSGAFLVSGLCFALSGCLFYMLLRLDYPRERALGCLCFLGLIPGSFFFAGPMSESLFLCLCLGCVYLARRGRWLIAGGLGACAAFTRSLGLMLFVPLCFEAVHSFVNGGLHRREGAAALMSLFLVPLGFAAYCLVCYQVSGDPFKFMEYQSEHWGQRLGLFFNTASYQTENALDSLQNDPQRFWGLWLPNLLAAFGSLGLMARAAGRLRPSYTAWFIAYFFVAIGATWLLSAPRYLAAMPVLPLALGLSEDKGQLRLRALALLAANLLYYVAFLLRWQVW